MLTADSEACKNTSCLNDCVGGCESESESVRVWGCGVYAWSITHMDPTKGDEVVLVLHIKDLFLAECLTRVGTSLLLGYDDVRHLQPVLWLCDRVKSEDVWRGKVEEVYNHNMITKVWGEVGWGGACDAWGGWCWQLSTPQPPKTISPLHAYPYRLRR